MANPHTNSKSFFVFAYVFCTSLLCVIPIICLAIFYGVQWKMNHDVSQLTREQITQNESLSPQQQDETIALLESASLSTALSSSDPKWTPLRNAVPKEDQKYFLAVRWGIYLCWTGLLLPFVMHGTIWLISKYAKRSPQTYHSGLDIGFSLVRLFGVASYLLQSTVAVMVFFMFSMFALDVDVGSVQKSVVLTMVLLPMFAGIPVVAALIALFKPSRQLPGITGILTPVQDAPQLWELVQTLCKRMEIPVPNHIILGVSQPAHSLNTSFVLHQPDGRQHTLRGRTLYLNFALLNYLNEEQLTAIIAANLHFFRQGSPQIYFKIYEQNDHFEDFMLGLENNIFLRPIYYYGAFLRRALNPANAKHGRQLRLDADKTSATFTSSSIAAETIVRSFALYDLMHDIESTYFQHEHPLECAEIKRLMEEHYARYLEWYLLDFPPNLPEEGKHSELPYPSLQSKLAVLGTTTEDGMLRASIRNLVPEPAWNLVADAALMEAELWPSHESNFVENHRHALLFRYLPKTREEWEFVESYFPPGELIVRDDQRLYYDCEKLIYEAWEKPIYYHELYHLALDRFGQNPTLKISFRRNQKNMSVVLPISLDPVHQDQLKHIITSYSNRSDAAVEYQKSKPPQKEDSLWQMVEDSVFV